MDAPHYEPVRQSGQFLLHRRHHQRPAAEVLPVASASNRPAQWCKPPACKLVALSLLAAATVSAHDPYEITSTAYLRANRMDLEIEIEFRTALSLAGVENPWSLKELPEELLQSMMPQLREAAGHFFQVTAGGDLLAARETNVSLGVEHHVRFALEFPSDDRRPLRFAADGLKPFEGQGPYGTTLIVLDMVNKKVLSQSVLYPSLAVAEVPAPPPAAAPPSGEPPVRVAPEQLTLAPTPAAPAGKETHRSHGVIFALAGLVLLSVAVWWRRRNSSAPDSQKW